jgi:replication factor C small subunit
VIKCLKQYLIKLIKFCTYYYNQIGDIMWTDTYRPNKLDDIVGNKEIIAAIKSMLSDLPHMLFMGAPGVGKTTTALAIVKELGCEYKEINASDEGGVDVVRTTIKNFMSNTSLMGKPKILILDEADATSKEFQTALRRMMEQYSKNCKIIMICNYPHKIIEPIKSRCSGGTFEFLPIQFDEFKRGILSILSKESMTITEDALLKLHEISNGDMRKVDKLYQISFETRNITIDHIIKIKDDDSWKDLLKLIRENKYVEACKFADIKHIRPIFQVLIDDVTIDNDKKMRIVRYVADWEYKSHFAPTDYVQLYAVIANIMSVLKVEGISSGNVRSIVIQSPSQRPKSRSIFGE